MLSVPLYSLRRFTVAGARGESEKADEESRRPSHPSALCPLPPYCPASLRASANDRTSPRGPTNSILLKGLRESRTTFFVDVTRMYWATSSGVAVGFVSR